MLERMPDPGDDLPAWLTADDVDAYVQSFTKSGFRGGLNWYRNIDHNWVLTAPFDGMKIEQPALFVAGGPGRRAVQRRSRGANARSGHRSPRRRRAAGDRTLDPAGGAGSGQRRPARIPEVPVGGPGSHLRAAQRAVRRCSQPSRDPVSQRLMCRHRPSYDGGDSAPIAELELEGVIPLARTRPTNLTRREFGRLSMAALGGALAGASWTVSDDEAHATPIHGNVTPRFERVKGRFRSELREAGRSRRRVQPVPPWRESGRPLGRHRRRGDRPAMGRGQHRHGVLEYERGDRDLRPPAGPSAANSTSTPRWHGTGPSSPPPASRTSPCAGCWPTGVGLPVFDNPLTPEEFLAWTPPVEALAAQSPVWAPGTTHGLPLRLLRLARRRGCATGHRQDSGDVLRRRGRWPPGPRLLDRPSRERGEPSGADDRD